ncbi:MAG: hypothetical protein RI841_04545 [Halomonas sp.]|nr:creatininase family protein [Halomonas sp.]MDR9438756.1 hypothetical protein [Halomonas sp.]
MRRQHATWQEVDVYLGCSTGVVLPIGSTEQHGPGIGALCLEAINRALG